MTDTIVIPTYKRTDDAGVVDMSGNLVVTNLHTANNLSLLAEEVTGTFLVNYREDNQLEGIKRAISKAELLAKLAKVQS